MRFFNYLKSFFWGHWLLKIVILILMINTGLSLGIIAFSLFVGVIESFGEMAILVLVPVIALLPVFLINFALLLGLKKIRSNWRTVWGVILIALSALWVALIPSLIIVKIFVRMAG